jgi:hypothetical protein
MSTMRVTTLKNEASTVDQIVLNADGSIGGELGSELGSKLDLAGGKILQVVSVVKDDAFTTSSTSFVDITGFSASITPSLNTSKVLALVAISCSIDSANTMSFNLVRGSTAIAQPSVGDTASTLKEIQSGGSSTNPIVFLDSPSTTSSTTYKIQMRVAGGTAYINRHSGNAQFSTISTITLMEVSA